MTSNILITNVQRFSLHDGPGIRTTVFLKGCSIHCQWCSNPENLVHSTQKYIKDGIEGIYGKWCSWEEIYKEVVKDRAFYTGAPGTLPGGVTFSGGECLLQMRELEPLLEYLDKEEIHTTVETCLFASSNFLDIALKHIDLFYVDIKILDEEKCKSVLHGCLTLYLSNLNKLLSSGKRVIFRIPVIGGFTDDEENKQKVIRLIREKAGQSNILKIELIKGHNLGMSKYKSLLNGGNNILLPDYKDVSDELMVLYKAAIEETLRAIEKDIPVEICKI